MANIAHIGYQHQRTPFPWGLSETNDTIVALPVPPRPRPFRNPQHFHDEPRAAWPIHRVPLEIFGIIISYLRGSDIKSLRLVCREFDVMLVGFLFRNVVVPFRSELYGNPSAGRNGATMLVSSSRLFCHGMDIFRTFGHFIRSFAISLELGDAVLAWPPAKPTQNGLPGFWGIFRWPPHVYRRFADIEGLEGHADEIQGMRLALSYLSSVSNLGLSCDCGLGCLRLPDEAGRVTTMTEGPAIASVDGRRLPKTRQTHGSSSITVADFDGAARDVDTSPMSVECHNRKILKKMLNGFVFPPSNLSEAANVLLETETTTIFDLDLDERQCDMDHFQEAPNQDHREQQSASGALALQELPYTAREPLIPSALTRQQKELLVELEWAQSAMIRSYLLGIMDNAALGRFSFLTTLTLSKLPSCRLNDFCRKDLWASLPTLRNISLGVIADWRTLTKPAWGAIVDQPVSPVEAVPKVFSLLNDFIGKQQNIERLHFEWFCGGEFAPSPYQRNQFVVPAPFVRYPESMVSPFVAVQSNEGRLQLSHVRHLSLKNCWASPHVLIQTIRNMALCSLEKLELESVSLSGPPTLDQQAAIPVPDTVASGPLFSFVTGPVDPFVVDLEPVAPPSPPPDWPDISANIPPVLSWAGFMDLFTPGPKLRDAVLTKPGPLGQDDEFEWAERLVLAADFLPDVDLLTSEAASYKLELIRFKSCGHVLVDAEFIDSQAVVIPESSSDLVLEQDPLGIMQHCDDKLLARIIPHFKHVQSLFLEAVFGMRFGRKCMSSGYAEAAVGVDGLTMAGSGRFGGTLEWPYSNPFRD